MRRCDGSAAALTKRTATCGAGVGAPAHADRDRACRRLVATKSITLLKVLRNREGKAFQPYGLPICGGENVRCVLSSNLALVISYFSARDSHGMDWGGAVRSSMRFAQCGTRVKGPNAARAQLLSVGLAVAPQHRESEESFWQQHRVQILDFLHVQRNFLRRLGPIEISTSGNMRRLRPQTPQLPVQSVVSLTISFGIVLRRPCCCEAAGGLTLRYQRKVAKVQDCL